MQFAGHAHMCLCGSMYQEEIKYLQFCDSTVLPVTDCTLAFFVVGLSDCKHQLNINKVEIENKILPFLEYIHSHREIRVLSDLQCVILKNVSVMSSANSCTWHLWCSKSFWLTKAVFSSTRRARNSTFSILIVQYIKRIF